MGRDSIASNVSFKSASSFVSNSTSNRPKFRMPLDSMGNKKRQEEGKSQAARGGPLNDERRWKLNKYAYGILVLAIVIFLL